jgi:selenide,water dikinase
MSELAQVLRPILPSADPRVLVDASTGDDAAVYQLSDDRALVVTVDFFSPLVDDPEDFGRIAVANALSDLYAMGARPLFGLNLFAFPRARLDEGLAEGILAGGFEKAAEAGVPVLGGHSIDDPEPKYGMVAVGEVHPDRMITNAGARVGDLLYLTKPLGTGVITTALKADAAPEAVVRQAVTTMTTLNSTASDIAVRQGVRAGTDVTGYGLLGHLRALLRASGVSARIHAGRVPMIPGALELAGAGHVSGGSRRNARDLAPDLDVAPGVAEDTLALLTDAQTSGGLLLCVPVEGAAEIEEEFQSYNIAAARIGSVESGDPGRILVTE